MRDIMGLADKYLAAVQVDLAKSAISPGTSPELLDRFVKHSPQVRYLVAQNRNVSRETLARLLRDKDPSVRWLALHNPKVTSGMVSRLVDDSDETVKSAARRTRKRMDGKMLVGLARRAIESAVGKGGKIGISPADWLTEPSGVFVTLKKGGKLRGCMGHIFPRTSIVRAVIENAASAAVKDPRFSPVKPEEVDDLDIEVSVLSIPKPLEYSSPKELVEKLRPGVDGVVLHKGSAQSTFLPQVWEELSKPEEFLSRLAQKAGLSAGGWKDADILTYQVEKYTE
jgi:AmmeMemoRadiSam system protein A